MSVIIKLASTLFFRPIRFISIPEGTARKAKLINAINGKKEDTESLNEKSAFT